MVSSDLQIGDFRRLEVDNPIVVFSKIPIFFLVSSRDVIHRFALPNLGLKIDAFPGRLKLGVRSGIPVGCF
jgi:heme/copper-type cytochrome/quinol oxidase subunit 2